MPKRPRDPNQLAKMIVDIATGELDDTISESRRHPSKRGRAGGLKGRKSTKNALKSLERLPKYVGLGSRPTFSPEIKLL